MFHFDLQILLQRPLHKTLRTLYFMELVSAAPFLLVLWLYFSYTFGKSFVFLLSIDIVTKGAFSERARQTRLFAKKMQQFEGTLA